MSKQPKKFFIAATHQNDGKTTIALGLIYALKKRFRRIGFIKPVGQRYLIEHGYKVDEDSVLIEHICNMHCHIKDMSPIAVERGFTEKYIVSGKREIISKKILESFDKISKDKDLVIIEGTGHAGVGSCFDWNNASVSKLLDAKVVVVSSGGIGRPIDELVLNKALFDKEGVELLGVIINKVLVEKYKKINKLVRLGLEKKGLVTLGVIPYRPSLSMPSIEQIIEETGAKVLCANRYIENIISRIVVGAMEPCNAVNYFQKKCLVITPGDREDLIITALDWCPTLDPKDSKVAGIVLTGGIMPHKNIIDIADRAHIPLLLLDGDTYKVASSIHDLTVKIRPEDKDKIKLVAELVERYIDIDQIISNI